MELPRDSLAFSTHASREEDPILDPAYLCRVTVRRALLVGLAALHALFVAAIVVLADLGETETGRLIDRVRAVPHGDHAAHLLLMGSLALVVSLAIGPRRVTPLAIPLGCAIVMTLVTLEELSQLFLARRTFDLLDLAADAIGVAIASAIVVGVERQRAVNRTT